MLAAAAEREERFTVCVAAGSFAGLTLLGTSSTQIAAVQLSPTVEGTRAVGMLVGPIAVHPLRRPC
jgi:hypothetical protein